ncbi:hypothetical protein GC169_07620 [bacterium]|nr:hypothetical protein [bacterium]
MSELQAYTSERVFKAPIDLVWRAWTDPLLLGRWFGPRGEGGRLLEHDLRPGGLWRGEMTMADGSKMYSHFEFVTIEPKSRLVWRHSFGDGQGGLGRHPMAPDFPLVMLSDVRLTPEGGATRMHFHFSPVDPTPPEVAAYRDAFPTFEGGWGQSFDTLDEMLARTSIAGALLAETVGDRELLVSRYFDAPPTRVFEAFTKPDLVARWMLGPPGWTMPVCEIDLRPGGKSRYVWRNADGRDMGLDAVFVEIDPPNRIVHRETFDEDWTGGETLITTAFESRGGGTLMTMTIEYAAPGSREGAAASGMFQGMEMGYQRLDAMLKRS